VKTKVYVAFGARFPLSKAPVSLVMVCVVESLFVQVTEVPALTVRVAGEKAKLARVTALPEAGGEDVVGEGVPYPDEHAARETKAIRVIMTDTSEDA
jgi:hypothetical protein